MAEIEMLSVVALLEDISESGLLRGQVGTVVESLAPDVYEVEFSDDSGQTYATLALRSDQLMRLITSLATKPPELIPSLNCTSSRSNVVMPWLEHIVVDPEVLTGKSVVRGTRLAVELILELLAAPAPDRTMR